MKKLLLVLSVLAAAMFTLFLGSDKKKVKKVTPEIDEEMAGPRGEEIYIGSGGGRYFIKNGKRIYVGYKGKKKHSPQKESA